MDGMNKPEFIYRVRIHRARGEPDYFYFHDLVKAHVHLLLFYLESPYFTPERAFDDLMNLAVNRKINGFGEIQTIGFVD